MERPVNRGVSIRAVPGRRAVALAAVVAVLSAGFITGPPAHAAPSARNPGACRLPPLTGWLDEGLPTNHDLFLNSRRHLDAAMLFVDFPDAPISEVEPIWRQFKTYANVHRQGASWLRAASYGAVDLEISVVKDWYRMSQPSTAYGVRRGVSFEELAAYLAEAVALADRDVDFAAFDIVYVVAGINAFGISTSFAFIDPSHDRVVADGVAIDHASTFATDVWLWGEPYRGLVFSHETGHLLGLPDLYSYSGDQDQFVAGWDIMADIDGPAPGPFAWHRWKLGWIRTRQVACLDDPGTYRVRLSAVERRRGTKPAVIPSGRSTAYVIESRRAIRLDSEACSTGVLIYEVDSSIATGSGPVRVIDATPGDAFHPRCLDLDIATFGLGPRPATFTDPARGITLTVRRQTSLRDFVTVRIADG
jgi:M6 family metalloprotease-like protein